MNRSRTWGFAAVVAFAATMLVVGFNRLALPPTAQADGPATKEVAKVDFNRDVRPILAENCFACHGQDEKQRKAKLRLDTRAGATAELADTFHAIVPGKPDDSMMLDRLAATVDSQKMPPPKTGKSLTPQQVALLRKWIEQGANYSVHWAFVKPERPALPEAKNKAWVKNPIDAFILARLEHEGLQPSPEADKPTLIRRVTLDLTGLPPTSEEVDAFIADNTADAYEKVVDHLLKSPRYGEHMARYWLDGARYGDTHGLHLDNYREIWPYRDWVVRSYNANQPYSQFVLEQLAGDLLPEPTNDQLVATGFNRCHVTTSEGGSIDEEVYVRNVLDRVDTTGTVFFGLTVGCARCHDHKFDPVKQKDYYQLFAFFNNLDGPAQDGNANLPGPIVKVATPEQREALAKLEGRVAEQRKRIAEAVAKVDYKPDDDPKESEEVKRAEYVWFDDDLPPGAKPSADGGVNGQWNWVTKPAPVFSGNRASTRTAEGLSQHFFDQANPGLQIGEGDVLFSYVYLDPAKPPKEIMLQWNTGQWLHRAYWGDNAIDWGKDKSTERMHLGALPKPGEWTRLEVPAAKVGITPGMVVNGWAFTQFGGTVYWDKSGSVTKTPQGDQKFDTLSAWVRTQRALGAKSLPANIQVAVKLEADKRSDQQKKELRDYFVEHAYAKAREQLAPMEAELKKIEKEREQLDKQMPGSLIFKERADVKPAYILKRGEYDQHGDKVERKTPAFLPPLPDDLPRNRLGLAKWLLSPDQPLTARVEVNRLWQQVFGTGIVKTAEDFGVQGEVPSHPELLDFLAVQFREDGWDVKKMMKRLVTSATYRQSAKISKDRLAKDPANRLLSRGPRFRLDAEVLRDLALAVSGLLVEKMGGPAVKPPQPAGLWEAVAYVGSNTGKFSADTGHEKVHRRTLYTFLKRTSPPPEMSILDAPSRESCVVRRERTNTPLQALMMLNDPQYVEAARVLAERAMKNSEDAQTRIAFMFKLATARKPDAKETQELLTAYSDFLKKYSGDAKAAQQLIAVGETKADPKLNTGELAAWTMIANLILNLDEVINKG